VIGKRHMAEEFRIVVAIECSPPTITILHGQYPLAGTFGRGLRLVELTHLTIGRAHVACLARKNGSVIVFERLSQGH